MTQPYPSPSTPRGTRSQTDYQVVPPQRTAAYPSPPESPTLRTVRRWPAAVGAGVVGLFVGVGLGASSSPSEEPRTTAAASSTTYVTETVQAPPSTVTVTAAAPAGEVPAAVKPVPVAKAPAAAADAGGPLTTFSEGTYEVGTGDGQIAPGKYKSAGGGMCYWSRLKHNDGALGDIIANNLSEGQMILNVAKSDGYVEIRGCTFTRA
jgi:hypothetical protein